MRLLITGGCGFLGSNLAAEALKRNVELSIYDNLSRNGSKENLSWLRTQGQFEFVQGDIRNRDEIEETIEKFRPHAVFHLSGQVAMTTSIACPRMDFEVNVLGTVNLLEAVRNITPETGIIYSSTNKVYGDLEQFRYEEGDTRYDCIDRPFGFDENTQLDFHSPYGCSKGAADQYMLDYARIFGLNTIVFRHSSMYGGRQYATYDQGWVGWFCQKAIEKSQDEKTAPFTISGTGKQVRDVLHADDMQRLYFLAVQDFQKAKGNAFNIGGGMSNSLSLIELFALLQEELDVGLYYDHLPERKSDQRVFVADTRKAQKTFGWEPQVTAQEGIARMLDWVSGVR